MYPPNILNTQPIEKRQHTTELEVHSIFYTIQGEGPFCGTPAVFVRLAGCNLQCPSCDTDYTSKRTRMTAEEICDRVRWAIVNSEIAGMTVAESLSAISDDPNDPASQTINFFKGLVVITGGEPSRQATGVEWLTLMLQQRLGCYVQIETNGTLPPPMVHTINRNVAERKGLYIIVSPKTGRVHPEVAKWACAYKYVMRHDRVAGDGLPQDALHLVLNGGVQLARPPADFEGTVYLQPQDDHDPELNQLNQEACIKSCMRHGYVLQLQVHKILGLE